MGHGLWVIGLEEVHDHQDGDKKLNPIIVTVCSVSEGERERELLHMSSPPNIET